MSGQPYMPFFFGDLLASTLSWSGEERALYVLLLLVQWNNGPLPDDPIRLARMVQFDRDTFLALWQTVGPKFVRSEGGGLVNLRCEQHRAKSVEVSEKRRSSGVNGAASRWGTTPDKTPDKTPSKTRSQRLAEARARGRHTPEEWAALVEACENKCVACDAPAADLYGGALCKDHVQPIYAGGSDAVENLQPMCRNCNSRKGGEATDYRPADWRERLTKCLAKRLANACHLIQSNPIQSIPSQEDLRTLGPPDGGPCACEHDRVSKRETRDDKKPTADDRSDDEFAQLQAIYPKREGSQRWNDARRAFNARKREGHTFAVILAGVERYAAHIRAKGAERTTYVQQAATFLGANRQFLEPWTISPTRTEAKQERSITAAQAWLDDEGSRQ